MGRKGRKLIIDRYNIQRNVVLLESLFLDTGHQHRD